MSIVITLLLLYFIAKAVQKKTKRRPRQQKTQQAVVRYQPKPLTKTEIDRIRREEQRQIKRLQAAEQAAAELESTQALRQQYIDLLAALEAEREEAATPTKKNTLTKQILSIEQKMIRIDSRMARLYDTANQICIA